MSLITRCPACGTMFKVVTDQLKVSRGWVRCGHCTEVFDASLHLQAAQNPAAPWSAAPTEHKGTVEIEAHGEPEAPLVAVLPAAAQSLYGNSGGGPVVAQTAQVQSSDADRARLDPVSEPPEALPDDDVSFVRNAQRHGFWRRRATRFALGLSGLLLVVFLLVQFMVQQRDSLAAMEPRLKPWLQMLCRPLQCDIAPLRHIETVVIDSSSFNKINADYYRLSFSLKNTGTTPVAMPSLEVTLTDTQEQALVRRVVTPAQFGVTDGSGTLAAGSDFSGMIVMQVLGTDAQSAFGLTPPATGPLRVAGYRVLAFYP
jgi:predicted Zn finger-like uncharacterized protein